MLVGIFLGKTNFGRKLFLVKKIWVGNFFWVKKIWGKKKLGQKNVGQFWVNRVACRKLASWVVWKQSKSFPVGGGWWVNTHNVFKPTSTWLWLSWVLTISYGENDFVIQII